MTLGDRLKQWLQEPREPLVRPTRTVLEIAAPFAPFWLLVCGVAWLVTGAFPWWVALLALLASLPLCALAVGYLRKPVVEHLPVKPFGWWALLGVAVCFAFGVSDVLDGSPYRAAVSFVIGLALLTATLRDLRRRRPTGDT